MLINLIVMAVVAGVAHGIFRWCAPHVLRRVPSASPTEREALQRYSLKKLWFGFLVGAMAALIVVTAATVGVPVAH